MKNSQIPAFGSGLPSPVISRTFADQSVAAVIVLYFPNEHLFERLLQSVVGQVAKIVVIDNTPFDQAKCPPIPAKYQGELSYIPLGENRGIATAQNLGIEIAIKENYTHVLLMDQDSALPAGAVADLLAAERSLVQAGRRVAAVGPLFIDEKNGQRLCRVRHRGFRVQRIPIDPSESDPVETDSLIASGSLLRTDILERVGLMRDELFIDLVDTEWAFRAKTLGYTTYIIPNITMMHSIGDATACFFGKQISMHSAVRDYYTVRNATYLLKEPRMGWRWRLGTVIGIPKHIIVYTWLSQRKWERLKVMLGAIREGALGTMRKFRAL